MTMIRATAVVVLVRALFLSSTATETRLPGGRRTRPACSTTILLSVFNLLQLTVYAMALGIVLGVIMSVIRLHQCGVRTV